MFQPMTPVEVADTVRQDGDLLDVVNTPAGAVVFVTRGAVQYAVHPHREVEGAVSIEVHQHDSADAAANCHARGVQDLTETVAAFEAIEAPQGHLVARSQQTPPTGMYV